MFKKTDRKKLPSLQAYNPNAGDGMSGGCWRLGALLDA